MKYFLLFFLLIMLSGCSPKLKQSFAKVSKPEKAWVFFHPFKAKKAFLITKSVEKTVDSIKITDIIGVDSNGGRLDAFKHSFWMVKLAQGIGKNAAYRLGKAHEKGNYQTFKKHQLEDGALPDKPSSEMDLFNNLVGINIAKYSDDVSNKVLIKKVLDSLWQGNLKVLSKDTQGRFLDCDHNIIPLDSLLHKWATKKCLVPSNEK